VRELYTQSLRDADPEQLLTTGEAAELLGVSRQHIVNLCLSGQLPYVVVGTHRRIRRGDLEPLRSHSTKLNRDQVRSLLLGCAVAGRVALDPEGTLALARRNLDRARQTAPRGSAKVWLQEWARLLDGPLPDLLIALTSPSPRSRELRQNTPFAGVLTEVERQRVLDAARPAPQASPARATHAVS
jgi:excisionase family DNA binding protein